MAKYSKEELINLEKNIINRYNDNELPFLFHLCGGNEDELIPICTAYPPKKLRIE